jgi:predicted nucleic acid-binding protein
MTGVVVVDASVWVSRLVAADVFHAASRSWFTQHALDGGQYAAPSLMLAEVVGAISRRTGQPELANRALQHLLHLPGLRLVGLDRRLGKAAAQLAGSAGLRGADAVYAALAQHLEIPLVTWDQEIGRRLGAGLTVLTPPQAPTP